jgi:hypothetical protein
MKELITTQLIGEYQKSIKSKREYLDFIEGDDNKLSVMNHIAILESVVEDLQSKQSEERQNIVDAVTTTIENTSYQKDGDGYIHCEFDGEDYFNQTFKQEQK